MERRPRLPPLSLSLSLSSLLLRHRQIYPSVSAFLHQSASHSSSVYGSVESNASVGKTFLSGGRSDGMGARWVGGAGVVGEGQQREERPNCGSWDGVLETFTVSDQNNPPRPPPPILSSASIGGNWPFRCRHGAAVRRIDRRSGDGVVGLRRNKK